MKINCDYFKDRRLRLEERLRVEHDWFAWYPVRIGYGDCRWLETVRRCQCTSYWGEIYWSYRPK